eukprot:CAMPEP_0195112712 /NCGR_PEP_ID=MMETSP0448-20130528/99960_1 /TAXON_ID=66468 /ORGANISM="Heterocapsa triquestra, Strain CCMP 448" /LENGTH=201 /DNA_ID=CAMNT_0040149577 /DNA_START=1 /DNA_END=603 /DNA_ORIENTATION=+
MRDGKLMPFIRKGWPVFDKSYDPKDIEAPSSFRKYQPPPNSNKRVNRDPDAYDEDNLHTLLGKFQFEAKGVFHQKGELAEKEIFDAAFGMHLVGWLKVRPYFMLGHLQGDTYALSYFKRWLEEKHLSPEAGAIEWVRIWEVNTGLQDLKYKMLQCVKDRRKYKHRKVHIMRLQEREQISRFQQESALKRQGAQQFLDANCV